MNKVSEIMEQYHIGNEVLKKLFDLSKSDLFFILKQICGSDVSQDMFDENTNLHRETVNDEPKSIVLVSYEKLEITYNGIILNKGASVTKLIDFGKCFTLDNVLKELEESKKPKVIETPAPLPTEDYGDSTHPVELPNGTYSALWGGYTLVVLHGTSPFVTIKTKNGVKGINIKTQIQIINKSLKII